MKKTVEITKSKTRVKKRSQAASILRRFFRNKPAVLGVALFEIGRAHV